MALRAALGRVLYIGIEEKGTTCIAIKREIKAKQRV